MLLLAGIQAFCGLVFGVDILIELLQDFLSDDRRGKHGFVHLASESDATVLLFAGYFMSSREAARLREVAKIN